MRRTPQRCVHSERLTAIGEIAGAYGVSENHLVKVVRHLAQHGYIETTRGKRGGVRLARPPEKINVGEVVRRAERKLTLVECFDRATSDYRIEPACVLKGIPGRALAAFFAALERYTLADLLATNPRLAKMLVPAATIWGVVECLQTLRDITSRLSASPIRPTIIKRV